MHIKATIIIKEAEVLVLGRAKEFVPKFISEFFSDFYFIFIGLSLTFSTIKKFLLIFLSIYILTLILDYCLSFSEETKRVFMLMSFTIPIATVIFARPSKFCFNNITQNQVNQLIQIIKNNDISSMNDLGSFEKVIGIAKNRVEIRGKKFKWVFASYIAICIFIFNSYWKLFSKMSVFDFQSFLDSVTSPVLWFILITPFFYILVDSYRKSTDAVFQLINLAIVDLENKTSNRMEVKYD